MSVCSVPNCKKVAHESWATVSVCYGHRDEIEDEFVKYYAKKIGADERETYLSIYRLTPWGRIAERKAMKRG
ncbi:hypothetical protein [Paenibacillus sp. HJGM_3]|uniref:hypothetical protein n=1 Tax=Paenibacillus sp. HJGM_3 TaxID=3379816 RepID=UPI00385D7FCD